MARVLSAFLLLGLVATTCGQATCEEGSTCSASPDDVTNLMQVKSEVSRHGHAADVDAEKEYQGEAWKLPKVIDDNEEIDLNDLAFNKDLKILARKVVGMHVSEDEMDGFYSRSKMFFKEPLSEERGASYCWKQTHTRGAGKIPKACPSGTKKGEMASWLPICYPEATALQPCKSGWVDNFLWCRKPQYGRGVGHFTQSGCMDNPLTKANGGKGCHKPASSPLIWYPVCKASFDNFGCCICIPDDVTDASCKKEYGDKSNRFAKTACSKPIDWAALKPTYAKCDAPESVLDAGLCYKPCNAGFTGVGPVCWEKEDKCVSCGMGLAADAKTCSDATSDQIFSVAKAALNLATLGAGGPALTAVTTVVGQVETAYATISDTINQFEEKSASDAGKVDIATRLLFGKTWIGPLKELSEAEDAAQAIRGAAKFAAQFEPTGVAQIIGAFTYEKCPGKTGLKR